MVTYLSKLILFLNALTNGKVGVSDSVLLRRLASNPVMEAAQSRKHGFYGRRANECRIKGVQPTGTRAISVIAIHNDTPVDPDQRNLQRTMLCGVSFHVLHPIY